MRTAATGHGMLCRWLKGTVTQKPWAPRTPKHQSPLQNKPCTEEKLTRSRTIKAEKSSNLGQDIDEAASQSTRPPLQVSHLAKTKGTEPSGSTTSCPGPSPPCRDGEAHFIFQKVQTAHTVITRHERVRICTRMVPLGEWQHARRSANKTQKLKGTSNWAKLEKNNTGDDRTTKSEIENLRTRKLNKRRFWKTWQN